MSAGALFHWLEVQADKCELALPGFLRYDVVGDPASWVQHAGICLLVTAGGALLGLFAGSWMLGARIGSHVGAAYYIVREALQALEHMRSGDVALEWRRRSNGALKVGWLADGLLDCAGPLLVATACNVIA